MVCLGQDVVVVKIPLQLDHDLFLLPLDGCVLLNHPLSLVAPRLTQQLHFVFVDLDALDVLSVPLLDTPSLLS